MVPSTSALPAFSQPMPEGTHLPSPARNVHTAKLKPSGSQLAICTPGSRGRSKSWRKQLCRKRFCSRKTNHHCRESRAVITPCCLLRVFLQSITCWPKQQQEQRDSCSTGLPLAVHHLFGWSSCGYILKLHG